MDMIEIYKFGIYFVIYSVLGWCCEVAFAAMVDGKFVNRGFLNGPYCPIYGFGVCFVLLCLNPIKHNFLMLFIGSVVLTSVLEYITGFVLEKLFHERWWDYSAEKFNLRGYVCLKFSIMWGLACLIVVDIVHPAFEKLVSFVPFKLGAVILIVIIAVYIADFISTVIGVNRMGKYLTLLRDTSERLSKISVSMGENISGSTLSIKKNADNLIRDIGEIKKNKPRTAHRLRKAFPDLKIFERESEIKKLLQRIENIQNSKNNGAENDEAKIYTKQN